MSFISLFSDEHGFVATNQRVFAAHELQPLTHVIDQAQLLAQRLAAQSDNVQAALQQVSQQGFEEGLRAGSQQASVQMAEALLTLHEEHYQALRQLNASCAELAVDIVRKIAGQVGSDEWLLAQAHKAAEDLIDYPLVSLRVHGSRTENVRNRLKDHPHVRIDRVISDDMLAHDACVLETGQGQINVDLETQLGNIIALFSDRTPFSGSSAMGALSD